MTNFISRIGSWITNSVTHSEANSTEASSPFDELVLSKSQVSKVAKDIKSRGFSVVAMSDISRQYLNQIRNDASIAWTPAPNGGVPHKDAGSAQFEPKVTDSLAKVFNELRPDMEQKPLKAQQFELRQPKPDSAPESWHIDRANKLVVLSTLEGRGTLFVPSNKSKSLFMMSDRPGDISAVRLVPQRELEKHVHEAAPGTFLLMATREIANKSVPALIHCSPPATDGRTTVLIRVR
ncbi:MAG: DUF1826 domain-containing protein [Limnobacter sp.]|nr:DUF1826 domain-containing protein [Limnobacter sp.]